MSSPRYVRRQRVDSAASDTNDGAINEFNGALVPYYTANAPPGAPPTTMALVPVDAMGNSGYAAGRQKPTEQELLITGLRHRRLIALIIWLGVLSFFAILLLVLNITLIKVLQMTTQGMRSLKIHTYVDERTGKTESAVHFAANSIDLGHIVTKSGKVIGLRHKRLTLRGSRVVMEAGEGNATRMLLHEGSCRFENVDEFQVISGSNGKVLFNANNPLVSVDRRIRQLSAKQMVTSKIRAPINENLRIDAENINLRGNEAIHMDARAFNATAKTSLYFQTSKDGAARLSSRRIFIGNEWRPLPISPSPALTASIDAYRVCICTSGARPKLFIVDGNKQCNAPETICQ